MAGTEELIRHALQEKLAITLVINKMDRLILELRLPPTEAFYKIKHTIEEVNTAISFVAFPFSPFPLVVQGPSDLSAEYFGSTFACSAINPDPALRVSPENGNVAFASTQMGWCFTLRSFAQLYSDTFGQSSTSDALSDVTFNV
jgi:U5 small nuclear ribonucleoprotein component